ncbi:MAG: four-carbon acid sugar kinase family protein, partial [Candidatus Puniceispirillaceae bacterium]
AGRHYMIVDAITDADLMVVGKALKSQPLVTGGSGIAIGLPQNFSEIADKGNISDSWQGEAGKCVAICGSCAAASRAQISAHKAAGQPVLALDSDAVITGEYGISDALDWAEKTLAEHPASTPLIYSSADPQAVRAIQEKYGRELAAEAFESFFGALASALVNDLVSRLIVAGGETSGAVVEALALPSLVIGPEIDPGVPALRGGENLTLALKSGNFGAEDFFVKAAACLAGKSV